MASSNPGGYTLNRDSIGTTRLTAQHYLWSQTLGFSIHPDVPKLAADAKVADVATGAGHWLLEIARSHPKTVQLDGFDVSLAQCPPKEWLPSNVKTHEWDMFQEPPRQFLGQYDLVHIRLVGVVIKDNNARKVIQNLAKLLKPGGFLQWDEVINSEAYVARISPDMSTPALDSLTEWMITPKKDLGIDAWKLALPDDCDNNGFREAKLYSYKDAYKQDPSLIKAYTDTFFVLCEEFVNRVFKPEDEETLKFRNGIDGALKDAAKGAGIVYPQIICVAQREDSDKL